MISQAQKKTDVGLSMGGGYSTFINKEANKADGWYVDGKQSFILGFAMDNNINERSSILFEMQFSFINAEEKNCPWIKFYQSSNPGSYTDTLTSDLSISLVRFQFPLVYRYYFGPFSTGAGIFVAANTIRNVKSDESSHSMRFENSEDVSSLVSRMDFGLVFDLGLRLNKGVDFFLRYNQGVVDLWRGESETGYYFRTSVYSMQALVGFRFFYNRKDKLSSTPATSPDN